VAWDDGFLATTFENGEDGNRMKTLGAALRRHAALVVFLAILAWIVIVVVLISLNPTPGAGSPV
jgi:hypothetical protein